MVEIDRVLPSPAQRRAEGDTRQRQPGRHVVIVAWRDIASPQAGGSELLVDQLAAGLTTRGDRVTLLCGGPAAAHGYEVVRSGGPYTQFLGAPFAYRRRLRDCDVVVEVCNGMPFLAPLWSRKPVICMVNHVHTDLWPLRFRPPLSTAGRFVEQRVMPRVHRRNLVLTVSESTARELESLGIPRERIRMLTNGAAPAGPPVPRSAEPLFLALGRARRVQADRPAAAPVGPGTPGGGRASGHRGRRCSARLPETAGWTRRHLHRAGERRRQAPLAGSGLAAASPGAGRGLGDRDHRGGASWYPGCRLRRPGPA